MTDMSPKSRNVDTSDPTWPPRVHIDWLGRGHNGVYSGETSTRDQKDGHISVGFEPMLPASAKGLGPDVTKGGFDGR